MNQQSWRDIRLSPAERAAALIPLMTLEEKVAQLAGVWVGADASGGGVAPRPEARANQMEHQSDMPDGMAWSTLIRHGLGQLTRPFGTAPVDPVAGARSLAAAQVRITATNRFGIPAQVHEECLTGFSAWRATVYPAPLSGAASFDPELDEEMTGQIGRSMRAAGVHQGLAPVLDVSLDYWWGRTEETMGEDPYLVGTLGAAYVRGLEGAGVVATLKHFAGYSASRGGRNLAPVEMGRRRLADVMLLREEWGFAGIDVELPTVETFGGAMVETIRSGAIDEALVDRALTRVLTQKAELGLLDEAWRPEPSRDIAVTVPLHLTGGVREAGPNRRLESEAHT